MSTAKEVERSMRDFIQDLIQETEECIDSLETNAKKYPRMKTTDVIDLMKRVLRKLGRIDYEEYQSSNRKATF